MKIEKRALIVLLCEILCCVVGGVPARIVITIFKNVVKNLKKDVDNSEEYVII